MVHINHLCKMKFLPTLHLRFPAFSKQIYPLHDFYTTHGSTLFSEVVAHAHIHAYIEIKQTRWPLVRK
jgi:hypothetical protein